MSVWDFDCNCDTPTRHDVTVMDGHLRCGKCAGRRRPIRLQRSRRKGYRMPTVAAVYVGRPTKWGNPWSPDNTTHVVLSRNSENPVESSRPCTVAECVEAYRKSIEQEQFGYGRDEIRAELAGKDLICWCGLCEQHQDGRPFDVRCDACAPCHADELLRLANA